MFLKYYLNELSNKCLSYVLTFPFLYTVFLTFSAVPYVVSVENYELINTGNEHLFCEGGFYFVYFKSIV